MTTPHFATCLGKIERPDGAQNLLGDPEGAAEWLERELHGGAPPCPSCQAEGRSVLLGGGSNRGRRTWVCCCGKQYTVRHGTWLYRGRVSLDKVLYGLVAYRRGGVDDAIEALIREARLLPETAEGLVEQIAEDCAASEASSKRPWRDLVVSGAAIALAVLATVWAIQGPAVSQAAESAQVLVEEWTYGLDGVPASAKIETSRAGFSSDAEWQAAHAQKVEAAKAVLPATK